MHVNTVLKQVNHLHAVNSDPRINALILDDSEFDRVKLRRLLKDTSVPISLREASDVQTFEAMLDSSVFDVVLIDHQLVDTDGFDALALLRQSGKNRGAACIMITGNDKSAIAVRALKTGCSDYIAKQDLSPDRLKSSIISAISEVSDNKGMGGVVSADLSKLTHAVMANYSNVFQMELAGILRQVRGLRAAMIKPNAETLMQLQSIERRCTKLWDALRNPDPSLNDPGADAPKH